MYFFIKNLVDTDFGYRQLWLQLVGIFQQYLFELAIPLVISCISSFSAWDRQCCLCLPSQRPLSSTEALPQPTPWPAIAAFPFIIQSLTSPSRAVLCCPVLLKVSAQLTPSRCVLPVTLTHFHCSATQFPPLILWFSAVPWLLPSHQLDVAEAAYTSSSDVLLFSKRSIISSSQLSLLAVLWGPPLSSCVLQVHIVSN